MAKDRFDGFSVELYLDEDGDWLAHFEELPTISAFGDSPETALKELETAWTLVKEDYLAEGKAIPLSPRQKRYSGQFNVRIDKRVQERPGQVFPCAFAIGRSDNLVTWDIA
jgi:predicted RNase H-like HicB family nuclease